MTDAGRRQATNTSRSVPCRVDDSAARDRPEAIHRGRVNSTDNFFSAYTIRLCVARGIWSEPWLSANTGEDILEARDCWRVVILVPVSGPSRHPANRGRRRTWRLLCLMLI